MFMQRTHCRLWPGSIASSRFRLLGLLALACLVLAVPARAQQRYYDARTSAPPPAIAPAAQELPPGGPFDGPVNGSFEGPFDGGAFDDGAGGYDGFAPGPPCCGPPCGGCCCRPRMWVSADYLLWWVKGSSAPPLVTTSPNGTAQQPAGVIGQGGTTVLFGGNDLTGDARSGGRVRVGYWLNPCQCEAIEAGYFGLGSTSTTFQADSQSTPILARPFFDARPDANHEESELVAYPGVLSGNISVRATSQLQGADVMLRGNLTQSCSSRVDVLIGYRFVQLNEDLLISDFKTVLNTSVGLPVNSTLTEFDQFTTRNQFNGINLGLSGSMQRCCWTLEGWGRLGLGNNYSQVTINGQATATQPTQSGTPVVTTTPAGLLAQASNIGTYNRNHFAVVPEIGVNLSRNLTPRWRLTVGYTLLVWTNVARPGEQIDRAVNLTQLAPTGLNGPARPAFAWATTDLWAQGLNFGFDFRF